MFTEQQKAELDAPLTRGNVKTRKQAGRTLSYIEGWHAIAEANRIFGFDAWHSETTEIRVVSEKPRKIGESQKDGWGVSYIAKVRITVGGIVREGVGSGHGIDVDLGLAHESAIKEAETDARKRALMTFGNPFGLALYDREQSNVVDEPRPEQAPPPVPSPDMAAAFVERQLASIAQYADDQKLIEWWNSDAEKTSRRTIGLEAGPLKTLMDAVVSRIGEIRQQQNRKAA